MVYLLWTLLNFALVLFFIVVCFRATKLIRERVGMLAAIIFVIGLLSFVNSSNNKRTGANRTPEFVFKTATEIEPNSSSYVLHPIEKYIGSTISLEALFGKETTTGKTVAVNANFTVLGLIGGHKWVPQVVSITPSSGSNNFSYRIIGSLKWMLLGIPVYSQSKKLEGEISVK